MKEDQHEQQVTEETDDEAVRREAARQLIELKKAFRRGDIGIASILMGITEIAGRLDPA